MAAVDQYGLPDPVGLLAPYGVSQQHSFGAGTVVVSCAGPVAVLELNRPDKHNALGAMPTAGIIEAVAWLNAVPEVTVVAVMGRGRSFCAGLDLEIVSGNEDRDAGAVAGAIDNVRRMIDALGSISATTVAVIHGNCVGGGVLIALACDLRFALEDARFWLSEVDLGIPLACGGVPRLVREVGGARAMEMILLCEKFGAARAYEMGLLNEVVSGAGGRDRIVEVVSLLARRPPVLLRMIKQQVGAAVEELASTGYAFTDAHLAHAALVDPQARKQREQYLAGFG